MTISLTPPSWSCWRCMAPEPPWASAAGGRRPRWCAATPGSPKSGRRARVPAPLASCARRCHLRRVARNWSWLFPPYRWHFSASAGEVTSVIEFDAAGVRELCQREPALGFQLAIRFTEVVVDRRQSTRMRLLDLQGPPS